LVSTETFTHPSLCARLIDFFNAGYFVGSTCFAVATKVRSNEILKSPTNWPKN